jgi:hypothetical protein
MYRLWFATMLPIEKTEQKQTNKKTKTKNC